MYRIGIDIGSTYTKYCVMDEKNIIVDLFMEKTPVRQKTYFEKKLAELYIQYPAARIVSCGYGKKNISAMKNINELISLAKGSNYLSPNSNIILDIGGQDTKIIRQKDGQLKEFFINDKCAAGSGIFLSNICKFLGMNFNDIDLTNTKEPEIKLSSACAVFAQSEIIELLADNIPEEMILQAVIWQILVQAKALLGKMENAPIMVSGGLTQIKGIQVFAENAFERNCFFPENGNFVSAIGNNFI